MNKFSRIMICNLSLRDFLKCMHNFSMIWLKDMCPRYSASEIFFKELEMVKKLIFDFGWVCNVKKINLSNFGIFLLHSVHSCYDVISGVAWDVGLAAMAPSKPVFLGGGQSIIWPPPKDKVKSNYVKNGYVYRNCCAQIRFSVVKSMMNYNKNVKFSARVTKF